MSSQPGSDLALAEGRLLFAACAYVDYALGQPIVGRWLELWGDLIGARHAYTAALRALPALPADHPLVRQGMAVVERLLAREEGS